MGTSTIESVAKHVKIKGKLSTKVIEGERRIVFVASSNQQDRDYEYVDVKSLRLPLKGGGYIVAGQIPAEGITGIDVPFMLNHSFDVTDVIGSVRRAYFVNDELIFEAGISSRDVAQEMLTLLEEDHLSNAMSITMIDYDYSDDRIFNAEVIEVSLVFRGSNKEARLLTVKSLLKGKSMTELEEKKAKLEKEVETLEATKAEREAEAKAAAEKEAKEKAEAEKAEAEKKAAEEAAAAEAEKEKQAKAKKEKSMSKEKEVAKDGVVDEKAKVTPGEVVDPKEKQLDKYDFAAKQFVAWVTKDYKTLQELNQKALESYQDANSKETYMNTQVTADGGAIVPSAQLLADVYTTLGQYSTVANDLRVITLTSGDSLEIATLVQDVIMSEVTEEGGDKPVTKPVFGQPDLSLREFAGIAILTKKLVRQAAINVYDILRESFARAIALKRAQLALTDDDSGIVNQSGVEEVVASGDNVEEYTWQDVRKMPYQVPVAAVPGAKYYISRELLAVLDSEVDDIGRDLDIVELDGDGLSGKFKNGFRFAVEEELGKNGEPHAVFGAMGRFGILLRQGTVEAETFDQGTVVDGSDVTHNLIQQNKLAHRVAFYENVGYPLPGAFAVLVAGESS